MKDRERGVASSYYPPRSRRWSTGRGARWAWRGNRAWRRTRSGVKWFLQALVPGLPFAGAGRWRAAALTAGAYGLCLGMFVSQVDPGSNKQIRFTIPLFMTIALEPVYLWYGLAAGIHVVSVVYLLRGPLLALAPRPRMLASLLIAGLLYGLVYQWMLIAMTG